MALGFSLSPVDLWGADSKKTKQPVKTSKKPKKSAQAKKKTHKKSPTTSPIKIKNLRTKNSKPTHPDNVPSNILVDLDYENTEVGKVLHYFMDPLKVQLKFHDGAEKIKISGKFNDQPWREAMESVLQQAGLQHEVILGVVEVSKAPEPIAAEPIPSESEEVPITAVDTADSLPSSSIDGALLEAPSGPPIPMDPPSVDGPPILMDPPGEGVPPLPLDPPSIEPEL